LLQLRLLGVRALFGAGSGLEDNPGRSSQEVDVQHSQRHQLAGGKILSSLGDHP
jgi:hypothetical protein